jgi:hypothetical protein
MAHSSDPVVRRIVDYLQTFADYVVLHAPVPIADWGTRMVDADPKVTAFTVEDIDEDDPFLCALCELIAEGDAAHASVTCSVLDSILYSECAASPLFAYIRSTVSTPWSDSDSDSMPPCDSASDTSDEAPAAAPTVAAVSEFTSDFDYDSDDQLVSGSLSALVTALGPTSAGDQIALVHGKGALHWGAATTYKLLYRAFPDASVTMHDVREFIKDCALCQKNRHLRTIPIDPPDKRVLRDREDGVRSISIDFHAISPHSRSGAIGVNIVKHRMSGHVWAFPVKVNDSTTTCHHLWAYMHMFGMATTVWSDPASVLTSGDTREFMEQLFLIHKVAVVDRHESVGDNERGGQLINHLLQICVQECNAQTRWDEEPFLSTVCGTINAHFNTGRGCVPNDYLFGSDHFWAAVPPFADTPEFRSEFLRLLNEDKRATQAAVHRFAADRELHLQELPSSPIISSLPVGELVLFQVVASGARMQRRQFKLDPHHTGPYSVLSQTGNQVQIKHLCSHVVRVAHVDRLQVFVGSREEAQSLANQDFQHHQVLAILDWEGDCSGRTFSARQNFRCLLLFGDDSVHWCIYNTDIDQLALFADYCNAQPMLRMMLVHPSYLAKYERELALTGALDPSNWPSGVWFIDLRAHFVAFDFRQSLGLEVVPGKAYVYALSLETVVKRATRNQRDSFIIRAATPNVFGERSLNLAPLWLLRWAYRSFDAATMLLVGESTVCEFPSILIHEPPAQAITAYKAARAVTTGPVTIRSSFIPACLNEFILDPRPPGLEIRGEPLLQAFRVASPSAAFHALHVIPQDGDDSSGRSRIPYASDWDIVFHSNGDFSVLQDPPDPSSDGHLVIRFNALDDIDWNRPFREQYHTSDDEDTWPPAPNHSPR